MSPLDFESDDPRWRRAHAAAVVIEGAREMQVPKLTQKTAATNSGIDPTYWPVVIRGWRSLNGVRAPLVAPDDTLLRMARAVGVESEVRILLGLQVTEPVHTEPIPGTDKVIDMPADAWRRLTPEQRATLSALILQMAPDEQPSAEHE